MVEGSWRVVTFISELIRCTLVGFVVVVIFTGLFGSVVKSCRGFIVWGRVIICEVGIIWGRFNSGEVGFRFVGYLGGGERGIICGVVTEGIGFGVRGKLAVGGGLGIIWDRGLGIFFLVGVEVVIWVFLVSGVLG